MHILKSFFVLFSKKHFGVCKFMDNKKITANIITNETVFNHTVEQAVDIEFTLPDFLPDINRILKCKAVSMISSKGLQVYILHVRFTQECIQQ